MVLLIDNYDSFSYNLVQLVGKLTDGKIKVVRNDEYTIADIRKLNPSHIILSPGPGKPENAGICEAVVERLKGEYPILGVCLGHQAIAEAFGATVGYAKHLMHGKTSLLEDVDTDSLLFRGLEKPVQVARYHSLAVEEDTLPKELKVTARSKDGEVMAMEHEKYPIYGVQFHPESVMTPKGFTMIKNFIEKQ